MGVREAKEWKCRGEEWGSVERDRGEVEGGRFGPGW